MTKQFNEKCKKDNLKMTQIRNENMVCKDCNFVLDDSKLPCNTSKCRIYLTKPYEVLDGGNCERYEKAE